MNPPAPTPGSPTSSNWRPKLDDRGDASLRRAADACAAFVASIERGESARWLTLLGEQGSGKTMLATQTFLAARKLCAGATKDWPQPFGILTEANRRPGTRILDESDFARLLLDDRQYDLPEHLAHDWLVCFDDLGSKRDGKEVLADAIYRLANRRLGKWTIWTTNLTLDEIAKRIDPRVSSRLIRDDNRLVTITAGDYAKRPAKR